MIDSETAANTIATVIQKWNHLYGAEFERLLAQREIAKRSYLCDKLNRFLPYKLALLLATYWPEGKLPDWNKVYLYYTKKRN